MPQPRCYDFFPSCAKLVAVRYSAFVRTKHISIQSRSRFGIMLCIVALVGGCSSPPPKELARGNECHLNPGRCIHEGRYEPGEQDYAEQEARRLNEAASRRLRRMSGW